MIAISPPGQRAVAARTAALVVCLMSSIALASMAHAATDPCWTIAPSHGQNGVSDIVTSVTEWDLDSVHFLVLGSTVVRLWDGGHWDTLGGAFDYVVEALAVYNGQLYAGGFFTENGGSALMGLVRWNGTAWVPVGNGLKDRGVQALHVYNGLLYIGGRFEPNVTGTYTNCAQWNGSAWIFGTSPPVYVESFAVANNQLYAGTHEAGTANGGVYVLAGQSWTNVGGVLPCCDYTPNEVKALAAYNGKVIAGGNFASYVSGNHDTRGIAQWDGTSWQGMGHGMVGTGSGQYDQVTALAGYGTSVFAAGNFCCMDNQTVNNIAAWNGSSWSSLAGGITSLDSIRIERVTALSLYNGNLAVTGDFDRAGNLPANGIALWNGTQWAPLV